MSDHIDDDTFEKLAMRELDAGARDRALAHVHACGRCAAIYKVLLGVDDRARVAGLVAAPRRSPWWIGAIAAVAAAAVVVLWLVQRPPAATVVRGSGDHRAIVLTAPIGDVRAPVSLAWDAGGATAYRIDVFTPEGRLVWSRTARSSPLVWPADITAAPGDYQWLVAALDGTIVLGESQVGAFRIVP